MKKVAISLVVAAAMFPFVTAQAQQVSKSDDTVEFRPHASLQLQGGAGYTIGEVNYMELFSPAAGLNLGYQFTPTIGMRLGATGWQGKGHAIQEGIERYSFNYVQGAVDLTVDLASLFAGYKHDRVFNPFVFVGGGVAAGFNNGANKVSTVTPSDYFALLWNKMISPVGRGGIGANIRLSDAVALTLEANANVLSDKFNSKKAGNPDFQFNALAGIKINLGKAYTKKAPVVVDNSEAEREAARLAAEREAARLAAEKAAAEKAAAEAAARAAAEKAAAEKAARDAAMQQINTFFELDCAEISAAEAAKLNEYAQWLKENPAVKIDLTGYADAQTGRHKYNQRLSQQRVQAVKDFLLQAGIAEDRITCDAKGDTVQPFSVNEQNRVVISLVK